MTSQTTSLPRKIQNSGISGSYAAGSYAAMTRQQEEKDLRYMREYVALKLYVELGKHHPIKRLIDTSLARQDPLWNQAHPSLARLIETWYPMTWQRHLIPDSYI